LAGGFVVPPQYRPELQKLLTAFGPGLRIGHQQADRIRADVDDADAASAETVFVDRGVYGPFAVHTRSL